MPLSNLNALPPAGWIYSQTDNNGIVVKNFQSMSPFWEIVSEVARMRKANGFKRATLAETADDVEEAQVIRLGGNPRWCSQKKTVTTPFRQVIRPLKEAVARAASAYEKLNAGRKILQAWLGEGAKPVEQSVAENRSGICADCPHNTQSLKFGLTNEIAKVIREQVEAKNNLKLVVTNESKLHTCDICWCYLPLKVFVPMNKILADTDEKTLQQFQHEWPECWVNKP
jgi:hypothetical protein